jgi:hypothetical protein
MLRHAVLAFGFDDHASMPHADDIIQWEDASSSVSPAVRRPRGRSLVKRNSRPYR